MKGQQATVAVIDTVNKQRTITLLGSREAYFSNGYMKARELISDLLCFPSLPEITHLALPCLPCSAFKKARL